MYRNLHNFLSRSEPRRCILDKCIDTTYRLDSECDDSVLPKEFIHDLIANGKDVTVEECKVPKRLVLADGKSREILTETM